MIPMGSELTRVDALTTDERASVMKRGRSHDRDDPHGVQCQIHWQVLYFLIDFIDDEGVFITIYRRIT
jgi:hypothetical protein